MRSRLALFAVLAAGVGFLAGCGSSHSSVVAGASIAPEGAPVFISVKTKRGSPQWKQALALVARFPLDGNAPTTKLEELHAAAGNEVDLVWVDLQNGGDDVVGLTKPRNAQLLGRMLAQGHSVHTVVDGWTVIANNHALLARFEALRKNGALSDDPIFGGAFDRLPKQAFAKVFIRGKVIERRLQQSSTSGISVTGALGKLDSIGAALVPESNGVKLSVDLNGSLPGSLSTFTPTLASSLPDGGLAYVFSSNLEATLKKEIPRIPQFAQAQAQVETLGGFSFDKDLLPLFGGEGAVAVYPDEPQPDVDAVFKISDEAAAKRVLSGLARLARLSKSLHVKVLGSRVLQIRVSKTTTISVAVRRGQLWIASGTPLFAQKGVHPPLTDDPSYKAAVAGSGLPSKTSGFVYLDSSSLAQYFLARDAARTHRRVNPVVTSVVGRLGGLLLYAEKHGGNYDLTGFLGIK